METPRELEDVGEHGTRYVAFLETIRHLRPKLHRYCSRMTGSVLDGEDIVQEALFLAYRKLDSFDERRPMAPWLFRIAHNRCVDFLRGRGVRQTAEAEAAVPAVTAPVDPPGPALGRAVEHLVLALPPKERACLLLKDVFDYSLEEIAELVDSTVGGVKAALSRGRSKLASLPESSAPRRATSAEMSRLLRLYVERFNQRDWDGVRELVSADARLVVADRFSGRLVDSPYFGRYAHWSVVWRMAAGEVDGEPVAIVLDQDAAGWKPRAIVHLTIADQRVVRIVDYVHCPWVLQAATAVLVGQS
jgi:RNA polymerase sigma-70 factor (ECF subfamily)